MRPSYSKVSIQPTGWGTRLCSDVVEVAALVRKNDVGVVLPDCNPETMARSIAELLADHARMEQMRQNCRIAARTECWENELKVLELIYPKVEQ